MGLKDIKLQHVGFGQFLSLLIAGSSIFSKLLEQNGVSLPSFQSTLAYATFAVLFSTIRFFSYPKGRRSELFLKPRIKLWIYFVLAVVDVQANYLVLTAFRYANFATVALLLHLTIPFVTVMSMYLLRARYSWTHYVGALISLSGSVVIFVRDYRNSTRDIPSEEFRGNSLCVMAAFLYSISNVVQEWAVSQGSTNEISLEFLSIVGIFATVLSGTQALTLEREFITETLPWSAKVVVYFLGYTGVISAFYIAASFFLRVAESLLFNISLLTSDVFVVVASYVIFDEPVNYIYWIAFTLNAIGITIYSLRSPEFLEKLTIVTPHAPLMRLEDGDDVYVPGLDTPTDKKMIAKSSAVV